VAITRARAALIIVGDMVACSHSNVQYLEHFVEYVKRASYQQNENLSLNDLGPHYPAVPSTCIVSDWEKVLYEVLFHSGIKTIPQYSIHQYSLDLALIDEYKKLDIEVDGEKYHKQWDGELCRRDLLRNQRLMEIGWDVMRFWVYEVRDDLENCVRRVQEWVKSN
jgi:very-short-patch-repair endonuclease